MNNQNDPHQLPPQNIIIAVVLSIAILAVFFFAFDKPRMEAKRAHMAAMKAKEASAPISAETAPAEVVPQTREAIINNVEEGRAHFKTDMLEGSISLKGGHIDDLSLLGHYTDISKTELTHLFSPKGTKHAYQAEFGWVTKDATLILPDLNSIWSVEENTSVEDNEDIAHRITLAWDNGASLLFRKIITIDHQYMVTVEQTVTNNGETDAALFPYGALDRLNKPVDYMGFFIVHEGPLAYLNEEMHEIDYDDVSLGGVEKFSDQSGWIGFTDKYWFTSLIPGNLESSNTVRYTRNGTPDKEEYQTDIVGGVQHAAPAHTISHTMRLYAGVKILSILQDYQDKYGIQNLELAIDFGIYYFLTKPLFILLTWLGHSFGHIGIGILVLTVVLKLLTFPLSNKAYKSMSKMSIIGPQMQALKEKHAGDKEKMQLAFMELYQKEGVNPFSGCWPMLIQIPIFFSLYKVILTNVMLRHVPFWGWIEDLSASDPTSIFNLFGVIPWDPPALLTIGAWPCLMGLTMYWLNRMSPKPTDATQAMIKNYFPYLFTIMMAPFAAGLVIYWTWSNVLTVLQQYVIMKRMGIPISLIRGRLDDPVKDAEDKKEIETTAKDVTNDNESDNDNAKDK